MSKPKGDGAPMAHASCTCMRLRKAARCVSQIYDRHLEKFGLTVTQFGLLANLRSLGGVGIGVLAQRLVMDPTTLTRNLQPLARRQLVALTTDAADRRSRSVELTADGRRALERARPGWQDAQRQVAVALGDADSTQLAAAVDRLLERLNQG